MLRIAEDGLAVAYRQTSRWRTARAEPGIPARAARSRTAGTGAFRGDWCPYCNLTMTALEEAGRRSGTRRHRSGCHAGLTWHVARTAARRNNATCCSATRRTASPVPAAGVRSLARPYPHPPRARPRLSAQRRLTWRLPVPAVFAAESSAAWPSLCSPTSIRRAGRSRDAARSVARGRRGARVAEPLDAAPRRAATSPSSYGLELLVHRESPPASMSAGLPGLFGEHLARMIVAGFPPLRCPRA